MPTGSCCSNLCQRSSARQNRGKYLLLADAPRDQLRILPAEIQHHDSAVRVLTVDLRAVLLQSLLPLACSIVSIASQLLALFQHDVHQLLRHDDRLDDLLAVEQRRDSRIVQRPLHRLFLAQAVVDQHLSAHAPVDLDDDLDLFLARQVLAIGGPLLPATCRRNSRASPTALRRYAAPSAPASDQQHRQHALQTLPARHPASSGSCA